MSKRAKRLETYLHDIAGWSTRQDEYECPACKHSEWSRVNFCSNCGGKMPKVQKTRTDAIAELEKAIAYALQEPQQ